VCLIVFERDTVMCRKTVGQDSRTRHVHLKTKSKKIKCCERGLWLHYCFKPTDPVLYCKISSLLSGGRRFTVAELLTHLTSLEVMASHSSLDVISEIYLLESIGTEGLNMVCVTLQEFTVTCIVCSGDV